MYNIEINFHKCIKGLKVYLFFTFILLLISIVFNLYLGLSFGKEEQDFGGVKILFTFIKIFPTTSIFFFFLRTFYYAKKGLKFKEENKDTVKYKQICLLMYKIFFDRRVYKSYQNKYEVDLFKFLLYIQKTNKISDDNDIRIGKDGLIDFFIGIFIGVFLIFIVVLVSFLYIIPIFFILFY